MVTIETHLHDNIEKVSKYIFKMVLLGERFPRHKSGNFIF